MNGVADGWVGVLFVYHSGHRTAARGPHSPRESFVRPTNRSSSNYPDFRSNIRRLQSCIWGDFT